MLAFTRRPSESFLIGEDIVVTVLGRDSNGNIQFSIETPKSVSVHNEERYKYIRTLISDK